MAIQTRSVFAPNYRLRKDYNLTKELLSMSEDDRQFYRKVLMSAGDLPAEKDGFFTDMGQSLARAGVGFVRGIGSTLEELGGGESSLREWGDDVLARNRQWDPHPDYTPFSLDPSDLGTTLGIGIGSSVPALAAGVGVTAMTGGNVVVGGAAAGTVMFGQIYGDRVKEYREIMPHQDEGTIKGLAFLSASGEAALESILGPEAAATGLVKGIATQSLKGTTKSFVRHMGKEIAKQAISEGSEEVAQDFWNRCVASAGTHEGVSLPGWEEVRDTFFGGAIPGAFFGGVSSPISYQKGTERTMNPGAVPQFQGGVDPDTGGTPGASLSYPPALRESVPGESSDPAPDAALSERQANRDLTLALAEEYGMKVRTFDEPGAPSAVDEHGNEVTGWYDEAKNEYWLNLQAEEVSPLELTGHEFKHYLNKHHPDLAAGFDSLVKKGLTARGKAELASVTETYTKAGYGKGQGAIEFNADSFGKVLSDPHTLYSLSNRLEYEHKGFGQRFLVALVDFIKSVRAKLKKIGTPAAKDLFDNLGELRNNVVEIMAEVRRRQGMTGTKGMSVPASPAASVQQMRGPIPLLPGNIPESGNIPAPIPKKGKVKADIPSGEPSAPVSAAEAPKAPQPPVEEKTPEVQEERPKKPEQKPEESRKKDEESRKKEKDGGWKVTVSPDGSVEIAGYRNVGGIPIIDGNNKHRFDSAKDALYAVRLNGLDLSSQDLTYLQGLAEKRPAPEPETKNVKKPEEPAKTKESAEPVDLRQRLREIISLNEDGRTKYLKLENLARLTGLSPKEIQERCELEIVLLAREINNENISDEAKYRKLLELYHNQPSLTKRTSTSVANQAYSTPIPLAWLLGKRIGLAGHTVYEPTAGTGMLTVAGTPSLTTVNEIDILRRSLLEQQGFAKVTGNDASTGHPKKQFERVIMNPPFSGHPKKELHGYTFSKLDHIIAVQTLEVLSADGKAAIIVGAGTEHRDGSGKTAYSDHVFLSYLYNHFHVTDNYIVAGDLYRKQGANVPVRVLTLSGRRTAETEITPPTEIEILKDWNLLYEKLKGETDATTSLSGRNDPGDAGLPDSGESGRTTVDTGRTSAVSSKSVGTSDPASSGDGSGPAERAGRGHEHKSEGSGSAEPGKTADGELSGTAGSDDRNVRGLGDRSSDLSGRTEFDTDRTERVPDSGIPGSERSGSDPGSGTNASGSAVSSVRVPVGEQRGELNNSYISGSQSKDKMDVVVPRFMASALGHSLETIQSEVGNIDQFVQKELGYSSLDALYGALSDVQIDGVAQAIHALKGENGFILGDQTGIGKGRQCAAIIRWAQRHDIVPVFFTRDQNLFTDMYRDGNDIGTRFNPLIVASDPGKANITDSTGKVLVSIPKDRDRAFVEYLSGKTPYDCVFVPYSQLSKEGKQREFLRRLTDAKDCVFIMDEAHEASGDSARGQFFYGDGGLLHKPNVNVLYASATFAKRPDNMALYFRTNIREAVDNIDKLKEVLAKGGVPLQQILSSALANDGQYTRRERDFTGVNFETVIADPAGEVNADGLTPKDQLIEQYDRVAYVLGCLVRHSELVKKSVQAAMKDQYGQANTREDKSVQMMTFASVTHNYISQLLLSSKCDIVVARAERAYRAGQKPVIALTNTLESVLNTYVEANNLHSGDPLHMKFSDILESALNRMYKMTIKSGRGQQISRVFTPEEFGLDGAHERILDLIHELDDVDLPVSPIDYIKHQLNQKGIKTGEITGRKTIVDYSTPTPTLSIRKDSEINKNKNVNDFNSGKTDAIILNASGSTGLSLHASAKFADQKQRNMIMAQPSLDIAVVQQMFGRVLRSGQVQNPVYEILSSPLAAERRPMMVLSRKLQSLNANTTANNKGSVSLGLDFMNKYGDIVAGLYLAENPEIADQLHLEAEEDLNDLMVKLTGKMAILPDSIQQEILDDLVQRYNNLIDFQKKTGNYDLEITVHEDWDVITESESTVFEGESESSIFKQPVILKEINIKEQRNIRSWSEVREEISENLGTTREAIYDRLNREFAQAENGIKNLASSYVPGERSPEFISDRQANLQDIVDSCKAFLMNTAQNMLDLEIGEDSYTGIITGFHITGKFNPRSPIVASKIMIDFAVTDSIGKITIPYSRIRSQEVSYTRSMFGVTAFTGEKQAIRTKRKAITGNLLRGLEYADAGKVVTYKTQDGQIESALLMPKGWGEEKLLRDPRNEIKTIEEAMTQLSNNGWILSGDGLRIYQSRYRDDIYHIEVPRAKNRGGKYFLDKEFLAAIGGEFSSFGGMMRTDTLTESQVKKAIVYLIDKKADTYLKKDSRQYMLKRKKSSRIVEQDGSRFHYSLRRTPPPVKTKVGYKVFVMKKNRPGELFPPMVANPGGESTPVGVWLDADAGERAEDSKTGRPRVQSGGKGTNTGKGTLAFRPGWHLGPLPEASQFHVNDPVTGEEKSLFPENFVFAECEFAADNDYQDEAMSYGYTPSGKFNHSYAGLPKIPKDGYYVYRTNPKPETVPWYISGAMKVKRLLTDEETEKILRANGHKLVPRRGGKLDLTEWGFPPDKRSFSLRRQQRNPVIANAQIRAEYAATLDDMEYTPGQIAEWEAQAIEWITRLGGISPAIEAVLHDRQASDRHVAELVRRHILNSEVFSTLPLEQRVKFEECEIEARSSWGKEGRAMQMASLKLDNIARIQAFFNKLQKDLPPPERLKLRNDVIDATGMDINTIPEDIVNDRSKLDQLLRETLAHKSPWFSKLYEFWINSILSGPKTHVANVLGNTANTLYELSIKRFVECAINALTGRKGGATWGEFKVMQRAINWKEALRRAKEAFDIEAIDSESKFDKYSVAIEGKKGRIIRIPGRLLRAADEFAKALIQPMESAAYAYREGIKSNLSGASLERYIEKQLSHEYSGAVVYGKARALELTFQEDPGGVVKFLMGFRDNGGVFGTILRYVLPFLRTPANILKQGIQKSPVGIFGFAVDTAKILLHKKQLDDAYIARAAEQLIAWGALMAFLAYDDEDELPILTGTSPRYGSAKAKFLSNKIPPYSIRIGKTYYSYQRIEPLATGLAFIADTLSGIKMAKDGRSGTSLLKHYLQSSKQLVVEKSYLESLGELNRVMSDPERSGMKFATQFVSSWVPAGVRQLSTSYRDEISNTKSYEKGDAALTDQFSIAMTQAGLTVRNPKLDYFGREVKQDDLPSGELQWLRRLVPIQQIEPEQHMNPAERLILNWNSLHPGQEYYPDVPQNSFERNGKRLYFGNDDYYIFSRESGQLALKQIRNAFRHGLLNERKPGAKDIELIKKIFTRARKEVREKMYRNGQYSQ